MTACAVSTPSSSVPIDLPPLPARLTACSRPVKLPATPMTQADVEKFWARDRSALVRCGVSLNGLVAYYEDLQRRLGAAGREGH